MFTSVERARAAGERCARDGDQVRNVGAQFRPYGQTRRLQRLDKWPERRRGPLGRVREHPLAVLDVRAADIGLHCDNR